ncbi:MAG: CxxC-x17-CxxC domain-containing protein [Patescibacteria group bacterium]
MGNFIKRKGFGNDRDRGGSRGGGFGGRDSGGHGGGRPQMFKATCSECGESCEVPFRPTGSKPVYCRECFGGGDAGGSNFSQHGSRDRGFGGRDSRRDSGRPEMFKAKCDECGEMCEVPFRPSGSKPVYCSECFEDVPRKDSRGSKSGDSNQFKGQFDNLNAKLDKILKLVSAIAGEDATGLEAFAPVSKKTVSEKKPLSEEKKSEAKKSSVKKAAPKKVAVKKIKEKKVTKKKK